MKMISMTELKSNVGILDIALKEDVILTKYGKPYLQITKPVKQSAKGILSHLADKSKIELEKGAWEREVISNYETN